MNKTYPFVFAAFAALALASLASARGQEPMSCCVPVQVAQGPKATVANQDKSGVQKATITIDGGYSPASVSVKAGKPVELTFVRKSAAGCDGELLIPSLKVNKILKQGDKTVVRFTPKKGETIAYSCGMNMYKGRVVVK
ncbi:MAG: cupredoxin domain-containing protein [Akkermansiaceae bacterium]|nr:cupredoxin domain-containing protein [Armatimonadota bacterium]